MLADASSLVREPHCGRGGRSDDRRSDEGSLPARKRESGALSDSECGEDEIGGVQPTGERPSSTASGTAPAPAVRSADARCEAGRAPPPPPSPLRSADDNAPSRRGATNAHAKATRARQPAAPRGWLTAARSFLGSHTRFWLSASRAPLRAAPPRAMPRPLLTGCTDRDHRPGLPPGRNPNPQRALEAPLIAHEGSHASDPPEGTSEGYPRDGGGRKGPHHTPCLRGAAPPPTPFSLRLIRTPCALEGCEGGLAALRGAPRGANGMKEAAALNAREVETRQAESGRPGARPWAWARPTFFSAVRVALSEAPGARGRAPRPPGALAAPRAAKPKRLFVLGGSCATHARLTRQRPPRRTTRREALRGMFNTPPPPPPDDAGRGAHGMQGARGARSWLFARPKKSARKRAPACLLRAPRTSSPRGARGARAAILGAQR